MKLKRIFALAGIVILAGMYIATLIFSMIDGEMAATLFRASLICTIVIPVFIYIYTMIFKNMKNRHDANIMKDSNQE